MSYDNDHTHDPDAQSWVESAYGDKVFPLQNLPIGVFSRNGSNRRGGIAIGKKIFDLQEAVKLDLFSNEAKAAALAACNPVLNDFMRLKSSARISLRRRVFELLGNVHKDAPAVEQHASTLLHDVDQCELHLPASIRSFTDFYAGIQHAINGGMARNPAQPLSPNYKYVPVAYHGRASSVVVSGTPIRRPSGQRQIQPSSAPVFGPTQKLDVELELGMWVGPGNELGAPIPIASAREHLVGLCMLNDWSARDVQVWESQPLGPFLAKNFATTISPWVVTVEALAPFRRGQRPRSEEDPRPLPYLWDDEDQRRGAFDIDIHILVATARMRDAEMPPFCISTSNLSHLYWTPAQMIAHHTSGGCNLEAGDLFGSGTISAPDPSGFGCLRELTDNEARPIQLPTGETRIFAENGDELTLRASAHRDGFATIGFGDCAGIVVR